MSETQLMVPAQPAGTLATQPAREIEAGTTAVEAFGRQEMTRHAETAATMTAAQARAEVEARYIVAQQRPRDLHYVYGKLINECKRPGFAEAARYKRPAGRKKNGDGEWVPSFIEGPSIRFAEACARLMGNLDVRGPAVISDTPSRVIIRVVAIDMETNASYTGDVAIEKTTEKRDVKKGTVVLAERTNSYGDRVYIVEATEAETKMRVAAETSKLLRTLVLRLVPGDIVDDCMAQCIETVSSATKADPERQKKRMVAAFTALGIEPRELVAYLGKPLEQVVPSEVASLLAIHQALKDGSTTWEEIAGEAARKAAAELLAKEEAAAGPKTAAEKLAAKVEKEKATKGSAKPADEPPPPLDLK